MYRIQVSNAVGKQHHCLAVHPSHLLACFLFHSYSISFLFCHQRLTVCACLPQPISQSDLALLYFHALSLILPMFPLQLSFLIHINLFDKPSANYYFNQLLFWEPEKNSKMLYCSLPPRNSWTSKGERWTHGYNAICTYVYHLCIYTFIYTFMWCVYISAYTYGWSLIIIPFLLSALSNHNIVRVAWHSYFYLSALKSSSHAALRVISLKYCSCKFLSKTEMSSKWFPPK